MRPRPRSARFEVTFHGDVSFTEAAAEADAHIDDDFIILEIGPDDLRRLTGLWPFEVRVHGQIVAVCRDYETAMDAADDWEAST